MSTLLALFETSGIVDTITSVIGTLLYPLFSIIFVLVDSIQDIFGKFAGIESMSFDGTPITSGNSGGETDTGIIYYLFQNSIVKNMLMSIMLLALFLIIIFTTMAFIKNVYSAKPKGWKDIIGSSIKGLANFIFLPVCCFLGVWLGNILLQAINGATSPQGATSMGRKLFIASSYNANVFRCDDDANGITFTDIENLANSSIIIGSEGATFASKNKIEKYVINVDGKEVIDSKYYDYYAEIVDKIFAETNVEISQLGYGLNGGVGQFYSLWQINYIVLIVGGIFMLYVLGSLAFAMIRRLFYLLVLFIISPGVCALYPLDDGKAVQSWSGKVKEQVLSAYGAVAGLNIFFSLVPLIDKIQLYGGNFQIDEIVHIFILVTGLMVVKELISLITGFVGGEDAYGKGASLMKGATQTIGKKATGTVGVFAKAAGAKAAGGSFFGSLGRQALGGASKMVGIDGKSVSSAYKDGKEHAFDSRKARADRKDAKDLEAKAKKELGVGLGSKFANAIGGEFGLGKRIDKTTYENAMAAAKDNPKLQKAIAEEYARSINRDSGRLGTLFEESKAKGAWGKFNDKAGRLIKGDAKVVSTDKAFEEFEKTEKFKAEMKDVEASRLRIEEMKADRIEAVKAVEAYRGLDGSDKAREIDWGNELLKTKSLDELKRAAEGKGRDSAESHAVDAAIAATHYNKLVETQFKAEESLRAGAEQLASKLSAAAEQAGKDMKTNLVEASQSVKEALQHKTKDGKEKLDIDNLVTTLNDINKKINK